MKKKRTLVIAVVLTLLVVAVVSTVIVFAQKNTEKNLEQAKPSTENTSYKEQTYTDKTLYLEHLKQFTVDGDNSMRKIGLKVCEKYNLDSNTVRICDMTSEMFDYQHALYLLTNEKDFSLLAEKGEKDVMKSLEVGINDVFAFHGAREIIMEVCDKNNIDVNKAVIGDLSADILMEIQRIAYEKSPHKDL